MTAADIGTKIRILVTATNSAGSAQAASGEVGPVAAAVPTADRIRALLLAQLKPTGKLAKIGSLLKKKGYSLSLRTLSGGGVTIQWYYLPKGTKLSKANKKPVLVGSGKASVATARSVKLTIKLTPKGRRMLRHAWRLKLTAKGTYTPSGRSAVIATKTFMLRQ